MEAKKQTQQAAMIASGIAFVALLVMGFGAQLPESNLPIQPSLPVGSSEAVLEAAKLYPEIVLRFFAGDSLFVLSYIIVFAGLFVTLRSRSPVLAAVGLVAGLLTGVFDSAENAYFITYARAAIVDAPFETAAVPLIYLLGNFKWMAAFLTLYAFGLIFPTGSRFEWFLKILMLIFPVFGVLGVALPDLPDFHDRYELYDLRGLFLLVSMPLFGLYFRSAATHHP